MSDNRYPENDQLPADDFGAGDDLAQDQFTDENWGSDQPPVDDFVDQPIEETEQPVASQGRPAAQSAPRPAKVVGKGRSSLLMLGVTAIGVAAIGIAGYTMLAGQTQTESATPQAIAPIEEEAAPKTAAADLMVSAIPVPDPGSVQEDTMAAVPAPAGVAPDLPPVTTGAPDQAAAVITEQLGAVPPVPVAPAADAVPAPVLPEPTASTSTATPEPAATTALTPLLPETIPVLPATPAETTTVTTSVTETKPVTEATTGATPAAEPAKPDVVTKLEQEIDILKAENELLKQEVAQLKAVAATAAIKPEAEAKVEAKPAAAKPAPVKQAATKKTATKKTAASKPAKKTATNKTTAKPVTKSTSGWVLRGATPGTAWVAKSATAGELLEIRVGDVLSGIGQVRSIRMVNGVWQIEGSRGILR